MPSQSPADESMPAAEGETAPAPNEAAPASDRRTDNAAEMAVRQLGEFRLIRRLGRGGMAEVYLAEQTSLHRQVAVKVLRPELLSDSTIVKRFEQEAKAAAGLVHPNVVQVYAFGEQNGIHYIAQEYVQGLNLRELLNRKGTPELLFAYHVMRQVAAALAAAADAQIVHRDIKPENILVTRKGEAKVADFGLAQLTASEQRVQLTQVGMTMGTPQYMSPEQINGAAVDHRSDIYSFGVTCYRMLSGHLPFRGETSLTLAMQHLTQVPTPLSEVRPDLPPVVCEIVRKMMAREPADRYQHGREILQDLKRVGRLLRDESSNATEADATVKGGASAAALPWKERFFAWTPLRHAALLALAAALVAGLAAAIGWWGRPANPLDAKVERRDPIARLETAQAQFERASQLASDEEAWKAVIEYFPDDGTYVPEARERLAVLDLKSRRLDEAKKQFDELDAMGRENASAQAAGIAGKAVVATLVGNYKESQRLIAAFNALPRGREQLSEELWFLLQRAARENSHHLGDEAKKQLQELFDDEP